MVLGFALSMWNLDKESLWQDELYSARIVGFTVSGILENSIYKDLNPPLYYLILHFWTKVFGLSETALRFPSVLFSVTTVGLVYYLGRLLWNSRAGLYAGLLTAISSYLLLYAQEARCYSLLAMLGVVSMISLWKMIYDYSRRWFWIYTITSVLMLYCHSYAVFHLFAQVVFAGSLYFLDRPYFRFFCRRGILSWLTIGLLYLPWFIITLLQLFRIQERPTFLKAPTWVDIPWVIKVFSADSTKFGLFLMALCCFWFLTLFPRSDDNGGRRRRFDLVEWNKAWFLGVWILGTVIPPFILSLISSPIFSIRYMISCTAAFYLLVGRGLANIPSKLFQGAATVIILLVFGYEDYLWFSQVHREQWRQSIGYIDSRAAQGELLFFQAPMYRNLVYPYYGTRTDLILSGFPQTVDSLHLTTEVVVEALPPLVGSHESLWLILTDETDKQECLRAWLQQKYQSVEHCEFGHYLDVYHFQNVRSQREE
ncbi:MAG: glycosyltransferase family 39 protein [Anaerohalosphaeraceae bacterium]